MYNDAPTALNVYSVFCFEVSSLPDLRNGKTTIRICIYKARKRRRRKNEYKIALPFVSLWFTGAREKNNCKEKQSKTRRRR